MITYSDLATQDFDRLPSTGFPQWDTEGVLVLEDFIPPALIDDYVSERKKLIGETKLWRPGWPDPCPYLRVPTMRSLATYKPLMTIIEKLIGQPPGLHLCLTGFQSTERKWHSDSYLNPENVKDRYIAAWFALDDVPEEAGPFEYVPGSQLWPTLKRGKIFEQLRAHNGNPDAPTWPSDTQDWVGEACQHEINRRGSRTQKFLGKKGDVLLWHAYLTHRGSPPINPELERKALIAHYSGIDSRPDMPKLIQQPDQTYYFNFEQFAKV